MTTRFHLYYEGIKFPKCYEDLLLPSDHDKDLDKKIQVQDFWTDLCSEKEFK